MRTLLIAGLFFLALLAARARAEEVRVAWPELARFVERHPRLAAGQRLVDAARAGVDAASEAPNPTVEGEVGQGFSREGGGSRLEWGLSLSIPLGWIAQRRWRVDAAEARVDAAEAERWATSRQVLLELRTLFWRLVHEQVRVAALQSLHAESVALVRTVARRVELGESRPLDALRVEIELVRVVDELESARAALAARQAELALWLEPPPGASLVAAADLDILPGVPGRDVALAQARSVHPVRSAARARARVREAAVDGERLARVPSFGLAAFTSHELDRRAYGLGLAIELPLWSWSTGRIAQAEAELAAERHQFEADSLELEAQVLLAQSACAISVETAARFKSRLVPLSEAVASELEKTYRLGEASLLEVLDSRRTLLEARSQYLAALAQAHIDCSRLESLVGKEVR
jgi:cobalt-zinc-cadmium efflux system outer membrane protein